MRCKMKRGLVCWLHILNSGCIRIDDSSLDAELELRLGCSIKLLVYRGVIAIQCNVCSSTIRVAFEGNNLGWRNGEKRSKLSP